MDKKYCTKCVIPDTSETLTFDKNNVCSVCNQIDYKDNIDWDDREKQLDALIKKYKNKNSYDCIVPFSGGKDSTFALWYLVKKKKLNPLVVRFDHNFLRTTVSKNTERTISKLGVDFLNYKPNFEIVKKVMLESLIRRADFCWHCHTGIFSLPVRVAIEKKIPLIFYGEPTSEYSSFYDYSEPEELNEEKFNKVVNLGINAEDMLGMLKERYPNENITEDDLKPYVFPSKRDFIKSKIKAGYLGNYVRWDVKEQVKIIKKELNWEGDVVEGIPEEYDYEKIECIMQGSRDFIKYLKRGFGRTAHLTSIDIRNNRMSREKALDLSKIYDGKKPKSLEILLKILKMSEDEFYDIVTKHVVHPHKALSKEDFKKSSSNIVPKDFEDWNLKFK